MTELPVVKPYDTMEEAWAKSDSLWAKSERLEAKCDRLRDESDLVVIRTAQALYGKDVRINWRSRTATAGTAVKNTSAGT